MLPTSYKECPMCKAKLDKHSVTYSSNTWENVEDNRIKKGVKNND